MIWWQVRDTVEVDQNVSRHLGDELMRDDWDIMVSICWLYIKILNFLFIIAIEFKKSRSSIFS